MTFDLKTDYYAEAIKDILFVEGHSFFHTKSGHVTLTLVDWLGAYKKCSSQIWLESRVVDRTGPATGSSAHIIVTGSSH